MKTCHQITKNISGCVYKMKGSLQIISHTLLFKPTTFRDRSLITGRGGGGASEGFTPTKGERKRFRHAEGG